MEIKFQLWIEQNGEIVLDERLRELLKAIDELHSLHAATKRYKMSYRHAWGKLRKAEKKIGFKLLESFVRGRGMRLTPEAKSLLETFDHVQRSMTPLFIDESNRHFSQESNHGRHEESAHGGSMYSPQRRAAVIGSSRDAGFHSGELRMFAEASKAK